jgi:hypothetical protein
MRSIVFTLIYVVGAGSVAGMETTVSIKGEKKTQQLRQEYNHVAAAIDTLFGLYGREQLVGLADPSRSQVALPVDAKLILLFWADDEAELFLNGTPISRTRLTPTQVEIPPVYLLAENELIAKCWDTDGVESGFMAGLYLQDASGLRPILTTGDEGHWRSRNGEPAQEFYYAHAQPDIPSAQIIWGPQLFGEVQLSAKFGAAALMAAGRRKALPAPDFESRAMQFHEAVRTLVSLQSRREELADSLSMMARSAARTDIRFEGALHTALSFSLGSAGPLTDEVNMTTAGRVLEWANSLPSAERGLVFHPARALKGAQAATSAIDLRERISADRAEADRRRNYVPPEERGSKAGVTVSRSVAPERVAEDRPRPPEWQLVGVILILLGYTSAAGRSWWQLYRSEWWRGT